ncbi:hypothetical protein EGW08_006595, partial [Elysia chlorotica]
VNVIEDLNRFTLVIPNSKTDAVVPNIESIRLKLQEITSQIVIIESVRPSIQLTGDVIDFNDDDTDVTFVVAGVGNFRLFSNTALDLVTDLGDVTTLTKLQPLNSVVGGNLVVRRPYDLSVVTPASQDVLSALQAAASLRIPTIHKSYTWWLDDPWAAFVALGGLVILLALVAIIVLLRSYAKYRKFIKRFRVYQTNMAGAEFTEPPSFLREYETQVRRSLNMYVPPDETVQELGEINMGYQGQGATPRGGAGTVVNPVYGKVPY